MKNNHIEILNQCFIAFYTSPNAKLIGPNKLARTTQWKSQPTAMNIPLSFSSLRNKEFQGFLSLHIFGPHKNHFGKLRDGIIEPSLFVKGNS